MTDIFTGFGKAIMLEKDWENLKCDKCGEPMELEMNDEFKEVKICESCGRRHLYIKKLKEEME